MLKIIGRRKEVKATIKGSYFFFMLLFWLSAHFDERANNINKIANSHAAYDLYNRNKESLIVILIKIGLLLGVISPKPTVDRIVAPQYQAIMYLSKLELYYRELPVNQV